MRRSIFSFAALAALAGCVERAPELSPADRERLREFVGTERPSPEHTLNVAFESGVQLLGYDLEPDEPRAGSPFTITWHWHSTEDLDDSWRLFTHVAKANGENALNQDGVGVVRELYQPGRWEANRYIRDTQQVALPADWGSNRAVFYLGFWNGEDQRLPVVRGPNDGENRVRAASVTLATGESAEAEEPEAPPAPREVPLPTVIATRATGPIEIDGQLEEADWTRARQSSHFVNTTDGSRAELRAFTKVLWNDDNLYVAFEVSDDYLVNTITERDGHLWEQDAVEIFVDAGGDQRNYFELQVSPTGAIFDTRYDTPGQPAPFGDVEWNSRLEAAVDARGTVNDEQPDRGYVVEIAIPWRAFNAGEPPAERPEAGGQWRVNFYVMDKRPADQGIRGVGWSAPMTNTFHAPARFGTVVFQGEQQAEAPAEPGQPPTQLRGNIPIQQPVMPQLRPDAVRSLRELQQPNVRIPVQRPVLRPPAPRPQQP